MIIFCIGFIWLWALVKNRQKQYLSFQFESDTDLVTASVKVLAVNQGGQRQNDACVQFLLIAQTYLADIIDLGANGCVLVQVVLATDAELGSVRAGAPRKLHAAR